MMAAMRLGAIVLRGTDNRLLLRATGGADTLRTSGLTGDLAMPVGNLAG